MSEQEPTGWLAFFQAEMRALRADLGGRIDRLQAQNTVEHKEVRESIDDVRTSVDNHLRQHQSKADHEAGARAERNKVLTPLREAIEEVPKGLVVVGAAVAGYLVSLLK